MFWHRVPSNLDVGLRGQLYRRGRPKAFTAPFHLDIRKWFGFWQGLVGVGVGSVIGVILELTPPLALSLPRDTAGQTLPAFAPPWLHLGLTAMALPAITADGSWLTAQGTRVRFTNRSAIG